MVQIKILRNRTGHKNRRPRYHRVILGVLGLLIILAMMTGYFFYGMAFRPNISTPGGEDFSLYIPTDATFDVVKKNLYDRGLIMNRFSFEWVAAKKEYRSLVKPGRYIIHDGMSNNSLVNLLRSGAQTPVDVTYNNIRTKEQFAQRISKQIEADSSSIIRLLNNKDYLTKTGFTPSTAMVMFIPNTYELWWNTSASQFIDRMLIEYKAFWNDQRKKKAASTGLMQVQVSILASIVEKETNFDPEKAKIAGVYLNRLKNGWPLQADPTLIYAIGDFELKRVLTVHKVIESPYNTYKYKGLPPGPICLPSVASIDAVLNYEKHNYMYFCAKPDLSGSHNFSRTLSEHNRNATAYQQALDRTKIK